MELYLLRHGQSEGNAGLTQHLDSDLTDLGRQQAERAGERLRGEGLTHLYVSPLRRTLQTVAPTCRATGLPAEVNADACEYFSSHHYAEFPGLSPEEIRQQYPFVQFSDDFPCADVWWPQEIEDSSLVAARAERVRDALLRLHGNSNARVLVVSHAEIVGRLIEACTQATPDPVMPPWSDNCAVSRLHCPHDPAAPATVLYLNDTAHLEGVRSPKDPWR